MFIKLTRRDGKGAVYITNYNISSLYSSNGVTTVQMIASENDWAVTETPEEIFDMIGGG